MATTQLNCRVEVLLANRLREAATARHTTTGALVAQAIEALLASNSTSPAPPPSALAALDARVERLEAIANLDNVKINNNNDKIDNTSTELGYHHNVVKNQSTTGVPLPNRRLTLSEADGLLTTPAVAKALGLASPSALTNWIGRQQGNGIGALYRGYRLRGKGLLPAGMNLGWLWEQASDLPHN